MTDNVFGVTPAADQNRDETSPSVPVSDPSDADLRPDEAAEAAPPATVPAAVEQPGEAEELFDGEHDAASLVKLGMRAYDTPEKADLVFKQFAGRTAAELARRRAAEAELAAVRSERDRLAGALEVVRPQQPPRQDADSTPATPAAPSKPKRLTDLISDDEFDALVVEHGPAKAFRRLAELSDQRLEEALEESQRDVVPIVRERMVAQRTAETFDGAAAAKGTDGRPLYPEIGDANSPEAEAVFNIWQRNFGDPALAPLAFTPTGIRIAVNEYRAANGQPSSRTPRTAPAAAVEARRAADRSLQSMGTDGRAGVRPGSPGAGGGDEEQVHSLIRARQHPIFGVSVSGRA
jgi:hypothetical protein